MRVHIVLAFLLPLNPLAAGALEAQTAQSERTAISAREQMRQKMNENLLFLMSGPPGAAYIQLGSDIAIVLNDGDNLRVLPMVSDGALTNVRDVLFLKDIDLGITTVQILNDLKKSGEYGPNLDHYISYIAPLSVDTLHVLARPGINTIKDLKGKKVSFNSKGSGTARFTPLVFKELGINVEATTMPQGDAIQAMRDGQLDATACSCPMPILAFPNVKPEWGFKLLDVPYVPAFEQDYVPASITYDNYPNLVPKDKKVETLATSTVLIAFNRPRNTDHYRRIAKFVDAFFNKVDELRKPARHPAWRNVNLMATIRGWQRFPAAQEWINRHPKTVAALRATPVIEQTAHAVPSTPAEQERLFQEFLKWAREHRQ